MSDCFDFNDITPQSIPVKVGGNDYTLWEASADAACRYRNKHFGAARYEDGKLSRIGDIADADITLLAACLLSDGTKQPVPLDVVKKWPERITKPLVQWVKEHSDMDDADDPLKVALQDALNRSDSPVSLGTFLDWVDSWSAEDKDDKKLRLVYRLFKPTIEERGKNEPPSTTGSSA